MATLTINGVFRACQSVILAKVFWRTALNAEEGDQSVSLEDILNEVEYPFYWFSRANGSVGYYYHSFFLNDTYGFSLSRLGLIFNISALPDGVKINSIYLNLWCNSIREFLVLNPVRLVAMEAKDISCISGSLPDFWLCKGGFSPIDLGFSDRIQLGYNLIDVGTNLPISNVYGSNYASYGIVEFTHDYFGAPTIVIPYAESSVDINLNPAINPPQLIINYESDTPDPITNSSKVMGII